MQINCEVIIPVCKYDRTLISIRAIPPGQGSAGEEKDHKT